MTATTFEEVHVRTMVRLQERGLSPLVLEMVAALVEAALAEGRAQGIEELAQRLGITDDD